MSQKNRPLYDDVDTHVGLYDGLSHVSCPGVLLLNRPGFTVIMSPTL